MRKIIQILLLFCIMLCTGCDFSTNSIANNKNTEIDSSSLEENISTDDNFVNMEYYIDEKISGDDMVRSAVQKLPLQVEDGWSLVSFAYSDNKVAYCCGKEITMTNMVSEYRIHLLDLKTGLVETIITKTNPQDSNRMVTKVELLGNNLFWSEEENSEWKIKGYSLQENVEYIIVENGSTSAFAPNITAENNKLFWYEGFVDENEQVNVIIKEYVPGENMVTHVNENAPISLYSPYFIPKAIENGFQYETIKDDSLQIVLYDAEKNENHTYQIPKGIEVVKSISNNENIFWYDRSAKGKLYQLNKDKMETNLIYEFSSDDIIQEIFECNEKIILVTYNDIYCLFEGKLLVLYTVNENNVILYPQRDNDSQLSFIENGELVILSFE